jgi:hypothetical protein
LDYNAKTGIFIWLIKPRKSTAIGEIAGMQTTYVRIGWKRRLYPAHRLAWLHYYGRWPNGCLDHINGKKLDNRISNLREATSHQNNWNRGYQKNKSTKGIDYVKEDKVWRARIMIYGKRHLLGRFKTPKEAHQAYIKASKQLHVEFARW